MSDSTSQLEALREVMNQLRSPGGCPWDAEQSHESLLKYLLEESYEFIEAVESRRNARGTWRCLASSFLPCTYG
jgi:uncharacterized protein YabN with tetrapyrrole methylase and pyrophosphatase domain